MEKENRRPSGLDGAELALLFFLAASVAVFRWTQGGRPEALPNILYVFFRMASIVGMIGVPAYFIGESLPRSMYHADRFPFKPYRWERDGKIYEKMGIKWRKSHTIDMSKYMKKAFPKQNTMSRDPERLRRLIQEMCNAELVHGVLALLSPIFAWLIEGWYGIVIAVGYAVSNLSHVAIQRYNRPRILQVLRRLERCAGC